MSSHSLDTERIETTAYFTWMGSDGIARTHVKRGAIVTLDEAKENSKAVMSLEGEKYPLLVNTHGIKSITKEARDHFAVNNRATKITAMGIVVNSPLTKTVGNFFMKFSKPSVPSKLFSSEEKAVEWLNEYK